MLASFEVALQPGTDREDFLIFIACCSKSLISVCNFDGRGQVSDLNPLETFNFIFLFPCLVSVNLFFCSTKGCLLIREHVGRAGITPLLILLLKGFDSIFLVRLSQTWTLEAEVFSSNKSSDRSS
ncbi:unnamed protein product [Moneuplotes crassus]|uniref:Uncharacterized protein n=1 Tax=Euplotes crassus TaxID=5936 RepID=A0AAD1X3C5_EUPCR|nr:unnamed protein product [Moneuplotes crassus]